MDTNVSPPEEIKKLRYEVEDLRSALTTVTEALVLFQEFIETEICEMEYFRESGCFNKLATLLNNLRASKALRPPPELTPIKAQARGTCKSKLDEASTKNSVNNGFEMDLNFLSSFSYNDLEINHVYSVPQIQAKTANVMPQVVVFTPPKVGNATNESAAFKGTKIASGKPESKKQQILGGKAVDGAVLIPSITSTFSTHALENRSTTQGFLPKWKTQPAISTVRGRVMGKKKPFHKVYKTAAVVASTKPVNASAKVLKRRKGPVKCNLCHRTYSSRGVMSRHLKEIHQAEPQFHCFYCPMRFRTGPTRLEHMNAEHPDDMKSAICPYCNRKAATPTGKRNHMMMCARKHKQQS